MPNAYPVIGDLPVHGIDVALVMRVLEPIWTAKTETASRLRGRIEAVLDWATVRGFRQGDNPARWRGHLGHLLPERGKVGQSGTSPSAALWRNRRVHDRAPESTRHVSACARIRHSDLRHALVSNQGGIMHTHGTLILGG